MNNLENLTIATIQSGSKEGLISYLNELPGNETALTKIQNIVTIALNDRNVQTSRQSLVKRSARIMTQSLVAQRDSRWNQICAVFSRCIFGSSQQDELQPIINHLINVYLNNPPNQEPPISNHLEALEHLMSEFEQHFGVKHNALKGAEICDLLSVSERIWDSGNVQDKATDARIGEYIRLMSEEFIGSHMLFEEAPGQTTLINTIGARVGGVDEQNAPYKKISDHLEWRDSSHYVEKVGDEKHLHIRGNCFSEMLMFRGDVGIQPNGKITLHENIEKKTKKAVYWKELSLEEQRNSIQMTATWRQKESYPDGPDWTSWTLHRTVDFLMYAFLKKVIKSERPQVAKYKLKDGSRGLPDTNPIIIRQYRPEMHQLL